jgi:hypothetical protein
MNAAASFQFLQPLALSRMTVRSLPIHLLAARGACAVQEVRAQGRAIN